MASDPFHTLTSSSLNFSLNSSLAHPAAAHFRCTRGKTARNQTSGFLSKPPLFILFLIWGKWQFSSYCCTGPKLGSHSWNTMSNPSTVNLVLWLYFKTHTQSKHFCVSCSGNMVQPIVISQMTTMAFQMSPCFNLYPIHSVLNIKDLSFKIEVRSCHSAQNPTKSKLTSLIHSVLSGFLLVFASHPPQSPLESIFSNHFSLDPPQLTLSLWPSFICPCSISHYLKYFIYFLLWSFLSGEPRR